MIINRKTGIALVVAGKARVEGAMICSHNQREYVYIARFDTQTVDHYPKLPEDQEMIDSLSTPVWVDHIQGALIVA